MTGQHDELIRLVFADKVVVICGREDDAQAWRDLFSDRRRVAIALDHASGDQHRVIGASGQLTRQHEHIAGLDGSGWLAHHVDPFDADSTALLITPDPLDPPHAGSRRRLGRRHPATRLMEDKTVVDSVWDLLGLGRAPSIVCEAGQDIAATVGELVDQGSGVACAVQSTASGPTAGGDSIWWWRHAPPPERMPQTPGARMRLMPLLEGIPVRLHGLVLRSKVVAFPPMEIVSLPRPDHGTFLLAGAVATSLERVAELTACTEHIGVGLCTRFGYRGAFSVDGVLTGTGFLPTDFNARLTSAMEAAPPELRVRLHLANLLAREGTDPEPAAIHALARDIFGQRPTLTLYGAATRIRGSTPHRVAVRWNGTLLDAANPAGEEHGHITAVPSMRGWLVTITLHSALVPADGALSALAPQIFQLSDRLLGSDFGRLRAPFGVPPPVPAPRTSPGSAEPVQRHL